MGKDEGVNHLADDISNRRTIPLDFPSRGLRAPPLGLIAKLNSPHSARPRYSCTRVKLLMSLEVNTDKNQRRHSMGSECRPDDLLTMEG